MRAWEEVWGPWARPQGRGQGREEWDSAEPHQWGGAAHDLALRIVLRSMAWALELVLVLHDSRRALGTSARYKGTMLDRAHRHGLFGQQSTDRKPLLTSFHGTTHPKCVQTAAQAQHVRCAVRYISLTA